jgi:hypothetical protein
MRTWHPGAIASGNDLTTVAGDARHGKGVVARVVGVVSGDSSLSSSVVAAGPVALEEQVPAIPKLDICALTCSGRDHLDVLRVVEAGHQWDWLLP